MTMKFKLDQHMIKMYLHTENEVHSHSSSKVTAWTDRHTDRPNWNYYISAYWVYPVQVLSRQALFMSEEGGEHPNQVSLPPAWSGLVWSGLEGGMGRKQSDRTPWLDPVWVGMISIVL